MMNYAKYQDDGQKADLDSSSGGSGLANFVRDHKKNDIDWNIVKQIKHDSGLLVFAKGVMCREDARIALEAGFDGIYISNHGARQLDTTPATIEVLPEIADEVAKFAKERGILKPPVYFDGGIRYGADILKAIALGADLVWIGRPVLWALASGGQKGVENLLRILNEELKEAMLSCGCYSLKEIH
jgi:isopentenyl diphosphate isomerase/L-lactate dehydrogenase-like FMN-dependent dehydrogenase